MVILSDGDRARHLLAERLASGYRGLGAEHVVAGNPAAAAAQLAPFADLGVDQIVVRTMGISACGQRRDELPIRAGCIARCQTLCRDRPK